MYGSASAYRRLISRPVSCAEAAVGLKKINRTVLRTPFQPAAVVFGRKVLSSAPRRNAAFIETWRHGVAMLVDTKRIAVEEIVMGAAVIHRKELA